MIAVSFYTVEGDKTAQQVSGVLASSSESIDKIGHFFFETTSELIKANAFKLVGGKTSAVDLVRDVIKTLPVHWVANDIVRPLTISLFAILMGCRRREYS